MGLIDVPTVPSEDIQFQPTTDAIVALEENKNPEAENAKYGGLVSKIKAAFMRSKTKRQYDETRWLQATRNVRGVWDISSQFSDTEKSQVFLKITKMKVLAAYAQVVDVLFAGDTFPIGVEASLVPNGDMPEEVHFDPEADKLKGAPNLPTATVARPEILGPLKKMLASALGDKLKAGHGSSPTAQNYEPIKMAAHKMQKQIHDQLSESDASKHLRYQTYEMCMLGTGIIKGPFAYDKEYPYWSADGVYSPKVETIPQVSAVSIWNAYPDADAYNMAQCEYFIERHKMGRHQLHELKKRPFFRKESINLAIEMGPDYIPEYWESIIEENNVAPGTTNRWEVLEYWGIMDKETAEEAGLTIPEELEDMEDFQINAWICQDQILRLVLNPFTPNHIPYYATPYEINPYSFFGVGVAENMFDTQRLMNGFMRAAIDNAVLSGNVILEIDETNLVPGQSMDLFPGKIFRKQSGQVGQSIHAIDIPNVSQQLLMLFDKARMLTDEATSMPSYAHGGTGIQGMGRTAAGMSMLMGAADKSVKAVVRNIDDYLLSPMGKNFFAFNMQFNFDKEFIGDLAVVARGTESLMRNEVRSQRLMQFLQIGTSNPVSAPLIKVDYILREIATSMDLEEDKILNDPREAAAQSLMIKDLGGLKGNMQMPEGGANTGAGTSTAGNAPQPGTDGFTGAGGGSNLGQTTPAAPAQQPAPMQ